MHRTVGCAQSTRLICLTESVASCPQIFAGHEFITDVELPLTVPIYPGVLVLGDTVSRKVCESGDVAQEI